MGTISLSGCACHSPQITACHYLKAPHSLKPLCPCELSNMVQTCLLLPLPFLGICPSFPEASLKCLFFLAPTSGSFHGQLPPALLLLEASKDSYPLFSGSPF